MLIEKSLELIRSINRSIDQLSLNANPRVRASSACIHLSLEHHSAIVLLVQEHHEGSAAALVRPQLEAYVRGAWLHYCATEKEVSDFIEDKINPGFGFLVLQLEKLEPFQQGTLSKLKREIWDGLCSYTHSGGLQVHRRNTATEITNNYSPEEVSDMLTGCARFALLASMVIFDMADDLERPNEVYSTFKHLFEA